MALKSGQVRKKHAVSYQDVNVKNSHQVESDELTDVSEFFPDVFSCSSSSVSIETEKFDAEMNASSPTVSLVSSQENVSPLVQVVNVPLLAAQTCNSTRYGLKAYLPLRPSSETIETIEIHKRNMKKEWKKRDPDQMAINTMMALTFADRREFIVKESPDVSQLLEEYPVLSDEKQASV